MTAKSFDVFVSYSRKRDLYPARDLARFLRSQGYRVWIDEWVLARKASWIREDKNELTSLLGEAIAQSRSAVIFAIAAEALPPTVDIEKALRSGQAMIYKGSGLAIAWSWQAFEFESAGVALVLYPRTWTYDSVVGWLKGQGIVPLSKPRRTERSMLRSAFRLLTRRSRVKRSFRPSADPVSSLTFHAESEAEQLLGDLFFSRMPVVLSGEPGSGRTTIARAALARIPTKAERLIASLPAADDIVAWGAKLKKFPERSTLLLDDFGDGLLALPPPAWPQLLEGISSWAQGGRYVLLVMTTEQVHEWSRVESREGQRLFDTLSVEVRALRSYTKEALREIGLNAFGQWHPGEKEGRWSLNSLCEVLRTLPVAEDLRPLDRSSLQARLLESPGKLLAVLGAISKRLGFSQESQDGADLDDCTTQILRTVSGLSGLIGSDSASLRVMAESIAKSIGINDSGQLWSYLTGSMIPGSGLRRDSEVLVDADRSVLRALAVELGDRLYGDRQAVLWLDYECCDDQCLVPGGVTESLGWVLKAVKRLPYWVICIERLDLAPQEDVSALRRLLHYEWAPRTEDSELWHGCRVLVDSANLLDLPESQITKLR